MKILHEKNVSYLLFLTFCFEFQDLEAKKIAEWSAKKNRIEEASRKKDKMDKEFAQQAKENLTSKMDNVNENREAILSEMKDKLKV